MFRRKILNIFLVLIVLAIAGASYLIWFDTDKVNRDNSNNQQTTNNQQQTSEEPPYTPINLQPTIDAWSQKYSADYSIAVYDLQSNSMIGQRNPEKVIFAASLYKLYVAYLTLVDFQSGTQNPSEVLIAGQTKRECVDKMIRESDSPCGEAMMAAIGQTTLNKRVAELGITNTTFNGIQTSAGDSVKMLTLIHKAEQLNEENMAFLLDAMLAQEARYKRGLQKGAPEAKWYTKVGWNLDINYHDVGIMKLADGRAFAVAILGQGSGSPVPIADFAATIFKTLSTQ